MLLSFAAAALSLALSLVCVVVIEKNIKI